jgi:hypothetical protein
VCIRSVKHTLQQLPSLLVNKLAVAGVHCAAQCVLVAGWLGSCVVGERLDQPGHQANQLHSTKFVLC